MLDVPVTQHNHFSLPFDTDIGDDVDRDLWLWRENVEFHFDMPDVFFFF